MHRFFLAAVVAALISPLPVVAQQSLSAAQDKKKEARGEDSKRPWTLLIYGAVDNDANDPLVKFLDQARRAFDNDPGIELLLFIDRSEKHSTKVPTYLGEDFAGTRLYRLTKDTAERLSGGSQLPEITLDKDVELNSEDAKYVQQFIAWGKAHYPAQRYALLIYSHANGRTMCPDDQSGEAMGFAELNEKVSVQERVDFLALELCNMGGIEIAYQWRPGNGRFETDVLLAIPNAGPPLDWDRAFARIRTPGHQSQSGHAVDPATLTAADFGKLVIEEGRLGRLADEKRNPKAAQHLAHESAGCYDLHQVAEVKKAVDALSVELAKASARDIVLDLRGSGPKGAFSYGHPDGRNVDLYDLARRIAACDRLPDRVRGPAKGVMAALERFMLASFGMSHYKGFETGKNGVYIVLPSGKPGCWQQFRWYTPLKGTDKATGRLSFLRDGATPGNGIVENWFELLDSWFNVPDAEDLRAETDADKKDKDKLQGNWNAISSESGGKEKPEAKGNSLAFKGDEFSAKRGGEVFLKGTFKVDSSKKPKTIDMKIEEGSDDNEDEGETARGIYKLEGDELTWCVDKPGSGNRPEAFATKEGTQTILIKLKREKE